MLALKIILGILLFFIIILSVKFRIVIHSEDGVTIDVRWLFIKLRLLPKKEKPKKKKKEKKKKDDASEETTKTEETTEIKKEKIKEPKAKKSDNIFVRFYKNNGVSGVVDLVERLVASLKSGFKRVGRSFKFEELYISLLVGTDDSAQTALKYGKVCQKIYPAMGYITSTMRVGKYSLDVNPDFVYGKNKARLHVQLSVVPLRLINSFIALGVSVFFKVVIKFLKGSKAQKPAATEDENINKN